MCGRFSQLPIQLQASFLRDVREADEAPSFGLAEMRPRYNLAPTQRAGVIVDSREGLMLERLRWGLMPFWAKDAKVGYTTINARVETVATKPAFRSAFKERRALIPMAGYFEWTEPPKHKQPRFVHRPTARPGPGLLANGRRQFGDQSRKPDSQSYSSLPVARATSSMSF